MPSQRWLHIIPVSFIMYTIAFIDRTNVSLALPNMSRDLHMSSTQAGGAVGMFFWGYVVLQIPGGYLAQRWSAKRFVSILLLMWGVCSVFCGLVHNYREFWIMRLLLGVAEGGVWPAVLVLLANWFPRGERARANAYWMLCLPIAVIVSSPLSGWILSHWTWRVLLIAEGALPFAWLAIWWIFIDDYPRQARWISPEELSYLQTTLAEEAGQVNQVKREPFWRALLKPTVLVMIIIYLAQNTGNYGYLFWLPTVIEKEKQVGSMLVGVLFAIPYVVTAIGMVVMSRHSDKHRERRKHVAFGLGWSCCFMLAFVLLSGHATTLSFVAISLMGAGSYGILGPFWAIPTETLPTSIAGSAIGLVNALGNLGGYFGPKAVGFIFQKTGDFRYAFGALCLAYFIGSIATLLLPIRRGPSNQSTSQASSE